MDCGQPPLISVQCALYCKGSCEIVQFIVRFKEYSECKVFTELMYLHIDKVLFMNEIIDLNKYVL